MQWTAKQLEQFFLETAAATYASGQKAGRDPSRPWIEQFVLTGIGQFSGLEYRDEYFTNGEASGGTTLILDVGDLARPLWYMHSGSWCKNDDKGVLGVLKMALRINYEARRFMGGRGFTGIYSDGEGRLLQYINNRRGDFADFSGGEIIVDDHSRYLLRPTLREDGERRFLPGSHESALFWHRYSGGLLVKLD